MKTIPLNSTMRPSVILSHEITKHLGLYSESWGYNNTITWVELSEGSDIRSVSKKISEIQLENVRAQISDPAVRRRPVEHPNYFPLMRITDLRLFVSFGYGQAYGSYQTVMMFVIMAIFILLIACINFMNLATARSANRAKEVGLRKTVGAGRSNIALQFFGESLLMTCISMLVSLVLVEILLPAFNAISEKHFTWLAPLSTGFIPYIAGMAILTGIISGTYPALFLSRFQPIQILKGALRSGGRSSLFRKILVVFQFSLSIILIVGTFVIYQQLQYMRDKKVGYDKEHLISMSLRGETSKSYQSLKQELLKDSRILGVSGSWQPPTSFGANSGGADWDGRDPNFRPLIGYGLVDFDFVETMKIQMAEGRTFSPAYATDTSTAVIVNEEVVKLMGVKSAVGKRFNFGAPGIIIGVLKNFHYQQVQNNIEPIALYVSTNNLGFAIIRLQGANITGSLDAVKAAWEKINPLYPFEYEFFDQNFSAMFKDDQKRAEIFQYAAIFAIIIACLGLFGLASFMVEQRTKEVGIRKVLGASIPGIAVMLSKEFIRWILVANVIAAPITYYLMNKLLMSYAYRITIGWWLFAVAAVLTLVIALITVSYQSIKAARSNPVKSLRYE
jgi:ABC-type lipoprotein release transport system permease subunit